jgi:uncharacterized protein
LAKPPSIEQLRQYAISRSLAKPTTLPATLKRLGFLQADPIRAPARAQDLTLRHRVAGYRAGDLEARYPRLRVEEDFFVNYGFVTPELHALMHPRSPRTVWPKARWAQAHEVLAFVRERGVVHPREVEAQFQHGKAKNWFGGNSNLSTQLLDGMHYRGLLRVARREGGTRCYAAREANGAAEPAQALDAMVDTLVAKYAPLPWPSFSQLVMFLSAAAPQWRELRRAALARARLRLPSAEVQGLRWVWPAGDNPALKRHAQASGPQVRLLAPFDPIVWDRRRFELFWAWAYRFEAYTPAPKRLRGYYALPLLWRDGVIGWANLQWDGQRLASDIGFVAGRAPREAGFQAALQAELQAIETFLRPRA